MVSQRKHSAGSSSEIPLLLLEISLLLPEISLLLPEISLLLLMSQKEEEENTVTMRGASEFLRLSNRGSACSAVAFLTPKYSACTPFTRNSHPIHTRHLPPRRGVSAGRAQAMAFFMASKTSLKFLFQSLHRLPVQQRIQYKINALCYKCITRNALSYIVQELCESRGGRPGLSVLTSLLVSVDVKIY